MEEKKGILNGLIEDAISNIDDNSHAQKSVNVQANNPVRAMNPDPVLNNLALDKYVKWFSELSNDDVSIAGGKGASLGEMYNNKFPVPLGFVLTAQAFDYFITEGGIKEEIANILDVIDVDDTEQLTDASKKIRALIESKELPDEMHDEILEAYHILGSEKIDEKGVSQDALTILRNAQEPLFVSVRSSATTEDLVDASFAGQQESFLNVKGDRKLIDYVKKCFSSLYTPRAIYYRDKKGFKEGALIAVVVQKMIDSEKSGVIFSKDPIKLDDSIAIESVYGLGEGIVSGKIQPDHYNVSKNLKINDIGVGSKKIAIVRTSSGENEVVKLSPEKSKSQVLTNGEILEVADYAIRLEEHYKKPQDIEFSIEAGKVYILQSRPITTLGEKKESKVLSGTILLEGLGSSPGIGVGVVRIVKDMGDLSKIKKGDVLVTEMTNPDMVVSMQKSVAIVTDEGGMTSHASIVSREMGIPAVVGTSKATSLLKDGMKVTVDGYNGKVYDGEVAETETAEIKPAVETERVKLKVILDLPGFAERAAESGLDAVGLMRLEGIIASSGKHPLIYEKQGTLADYTELLRKGIEEIVKHFESVWIRSSDIRTDEFSSLEGALEREINPMLGFHGVRFSLKHPEILKAELNAIRLVAEKYPNKKLGVMFPQIISIKEVKNVKEYFNEIKTENMEFGVMIETPAAVQIIEDICEEVDFISFGTNDLTQFTLAVDRGEDNVQYLYDELHPAVFSQIRKVINTCRSKNVETSICGQAGSKKEMVEFLFKKGINSISVNADAAAEISHVIKGLEVEWNRLKHEREQEKQRLEEERRKEKEEKKRQDEERRKQEQERQRQEQERKREDEKRKQEEEKRRQDQERQKQDEEMRKQEERRREEQRKQDEIRRKEEERRRQEQPRQPRGNNQNQQRFVNAQSSQGQHSTVNVQPSQGGQMGDRNQGGSSPEGSDRRDNNRNRDGQDNRQGQDRDNRWKKKKWNKRKFKKSNEHWNKKAQVLPELEKKSGQQDNQNQEKVVDASMDTYKQRQEQKLSDQNKIQMPAEVKQTTKETIEQTSDYQKNVGQIKPFGDTSRIDEKAEEIHDKVEQENKEDLQQFKKWEDNIEITGGETSEEERKLEDLQQEAEEDKTEIRAEELLQDIDSVEEKTEGETESTINNQNQQDIPQDRHVEESSNNEQNVINKVNEETTSSDTEASEETVSSDADTSEDIGVYNPEEKEEEKSEYKYFNDDW